MANHTKLTNSPYVFFVGQEWVRTVPHLYLITLDEINAIQLYNKALFNLISVDFMWRSIHFKLHVKIFKLKNFQVNFYWLK